MLWEKGLFNVFVKKLLCGIIFLQAIIWSMDVSLSIDRIKRWGLKGGLGVLDQGLYSGVNFLLSVLLARWTSPDVYGGFSAAYSLFLLFSIAQVALIAEPMSIFGADKYRQKTIPYLNYLLRIQWVGTFLGTLVFLVFALFITNHVLRNAVMAMAVVLPFVLYYWYLRRAFYLEMQSGMAMVASFVYSILLIIFIVLIRLAGHLTSSTAYLAMALSSLIASFFALEHLGLRFWGKGSNGTCLNSGMVNRELWDFGKWILLAYLAGWFTSLSFPLIIMILLDAQSAGAFRALQNLFLPFQQLLAAITLLSLPWLTRQNSDYGGKKLFSITEAIAGVTFVVAAIYCFLVVILQHRIVTFLYTNEFYLSFDNLIIFLSISTLLGSAPLILGLALRVLGNPNTILWSKGCAAVFTFLLGIPMIWFFKMNGVLFSLLGGTLIEIFVLLLFYFKIRMVRNIAEPS